MEVSDWKCSFKIKADTCLYQSVTEVETSLVLNSFRGYCLHLHCRWKMIKILIELKYYSANGISRDI